MNRALFLSTYRRSFKLFLVFAVLSMFYLVSTIAMYTGGESDPFEALPETMKNAFGISSGIQGLTGFLATGFYGATFVIFLMIYCIIVSNQLMAQLVDRGSMAYFMSTPVSRKRIALTQASVLLVNLAAISVLLSLTGLVMSPALHSDGQLDTASFLQINLVGFLLFFLISGYAFLFSCLMNESKHALTASGLLSVVFYALQLISNMSDDAQWMSNLTVLAAFQPLEIAASSFPVLPTSLALGASGILLYGCGIWLFSKRNLPL